MLDLASFRWLDSKLPPDGLDPTIIIVPPTPDDTPLYAETVA